MTTRATTGISAAQRTETMLNVNQLALLEMLKASLFGAEPVFPEGVDWDEVLTEAKAQTVVALAAPSAPQEQAAKWREPAQMSLVHFVRCMHEQNNLICLFGEHGIPMVILKGACAAVYYPNPSARTMGDIDVMTPKARFDEARELIENSGYEYFFDNGDDRDYEYKKNGVTVELHHNYSDKGWDIDPLIEEGISGAEIKTINGSSFPSLPTYINGLVLLDHARHHLYGGLGIRQIIDWMMFVHAQLGDEEWENDFRPLARDAGLETFAVIMTAMCREWFGLPDDIGWCEGADMAAAEQHVFSSGNFGRKTPYVYRPMENITMDVKKNGLFRTLQSAGELNWKACQRHRFLKPFAWLYQLFRFMFRGVKALLGGADFRKDITTGSEKDDFYLRLGIRR